MSSSLLKFCDTHFSYSGCLWSLWSTLVQNAGWSRHCLPKHNTKTPHRPVDHPQRANKWEATFPYSLARDSSPISFMTHPKSHPSLVILMILLCKLSFFGSTKRPHGPCGPHGPHGRLVKVNLLCDGWCDWLRPDVKVVALEVLRFLGGMEKQIMSWRGNWWISEAVVVYYG